MRENILFHWQRPLKQRDHRPVLIFAQYEADASAPIRPDIPELLKHYRKHFYVIIIAATPSFLKQPRSISELQKASDCVIIRCNEGYDYGSWMTGLRISKDLIKNRQQVVLTNDSFWGPVRPLNGLLERLEQSSGDVSGLTDNLMYEPHLQTPFLLFKNKAIQCQAFWTFWENIQRWENKRSIIKNYEVGLPVLLREQGMKLESLYSNDSNGNIFQAEWRSLILDHGFPFLKVSLLRDNPHQVNIDDWPMVVNRNNPRLTRQIQTQLLQWKAINDT